MKLSTRFSVPLVLAASLVSKVSAVAVPEAIALPWAQANPQAYAAANAYADAYAEAVAIAHPDPEAYALAASADDCASISCHASCGLLIIEGQACSQNSENSYSGPYNTTCLCSSGSKFLQYYAPCMDCGWTLWKYYGGYVSSALAACETLSTEPTGTLRCSTTLTDSYSIDTGIQGCSYLGNCPTETSSTAQTTDSPDQTSAAPTSAEPTSDAPSSTQAAPSTQQTDPAAPTSEEAPTAPTSSADEPNAPSSNEASAVPTNSNGEPNAPNSDANTSGSPAPGGATSGQEEPSALDPAASSTSAKFSGYINGTTSTAVVSHDSTTLVTVTSCDENKCTEVPSTAQVSIATTTINGVVTSYTTYCPLTTTTAPTTKASTDKQTTKAPTDVTSKVTATTTKTGPSTLASTTPVISTFEAAANKLAGSVGAILMAWLFI